MRFLQSLIFLLVLVAILIFAVQNNDILTLKFLNWSLNAPVSLLTIATYLLGMISGWSFVGFLSRSFRRVTESPRS
jgi:lipopolysaccharide assembly protein A